MKMSEVTEEDISSHYGCIYLTTNLINGRIYVGKQSFKRKIDHYRYLGSGKVIGQAIRKYGRENFSKEVIQFVESELEASESEKRWISEYREKYGSLLYNLTEGGEGANNFTSEGIVKSHEVIREKYGDNYSHLNNPETASKRAETMRDRRSGIYSEEAFKSRSGAYEYSGHIYYGRTNLYKALLADGYELSHMQVHHIADGYASKKVKEKYPDILNIIRRIK